MASPMAGCPMLRDAGASAFARAQAQVHLCKMYYRTEKGPTLHSAHVPVGLMRGSSCTGSAQRILLQGGRTQGLVLEHPSVGVPFCSAFLQYYVKEM